MKKYGCFLFCLILVFSLAGCNLKSPVEESLPVTQAAVISDSSQKVIDTFLEDWLNLLILQETRLAQENYTLELILRIQNAPTWENYVYAQTACGFTCDLIESLSQRSLEPSMTNADYQMLMDMGMDIGDVQTEYRTYNEVTLPDLKEYDWVIWQDYYLQNLMYACFDENTVTLVLEAAQNRYQVNEANLKYWYLINNFIMLELPEDDAEKLLALAEEHAPVVMAQYSNLFPTSNEVLNEISRVLNQQEDILLKMKEVEAAWELLMESKKFTAKEIEGLPMLIRAPESVSVDDWFVRYYWKDEENVKAAEYLMEMDTLPNGLMIEIENVSLDAFQQYVVELDADGLTPSDLNDTAAIYALSNGVQMMVFYEENTIHISVTNGQVCFAPLWYIHALEQE